MTQNLLILALIFTISTIGWSVKLGMGLPSMLAGLIVAAIIAGDMQWRRE